MAACDGAPASDDAGTIDVVGDELAPSCPALSCGIAEVATACACVHEPRAADEARRTSCATIGGTPADDACTPDAPGSAPDTGCLASAPPPLGEARNVTLYGLVEVLGGGPGTDGVSVEVRTQGAAGAPLGIATATIASPCALVPGEEMPEARALAFYAIPDVPTETPLVIVTGQGGGDWVTTSEQGVVLRNDAIESGAPPGGACEGTPAGDRVRRDARVVSIGDFRSLPLDAALGATVPASRGIVIGEVRDCAGVRVEGALVGASQRAGAVVYPSVGVDFDPISLGTGPEGRWVAISLPAGTVRLAAIGRVSGALTSLGWASADVVAGGVTLRTIQGPPR